MIASSSSSSSSLSSSSSRRFYVTTAISYPNGAPHIGHAYEAIATDALARFARLDGARTFFLTGTDEHGLKMIQTARSEGLEPRALADRNAPLFASMCETLSCSPDRFIRTSEEAHHRACRELWRRMRDAGDLYKDVYAGWYSVRDEAFYDESELTIDGDVRLSPQGTAAEWVEEESYFFRLSSYGERLLRLYDENPDFIAPKARRNEVIRFVEGGLRDLSVSRKNLPWGVGVPDDSEHVMYVWVDALTNYLTGIGFPDENASAWSEFWPPDVHVIGKDIIRFHAVYWPAFLMSAGLPLPKRLFAHGFLFHQGEKMSKSAGNVVDPFALSETYGSDPLRYYLLRETPFGEDGKYSHESIVSRINGDLANGLGNLAQRCLSMLSAKCEGRALEPSDPDDQNANDVLNEMRRHHNQLAPHKALETLWKYVSEADKTFAKEQPWKQPQNKMENILGNTLNRLRNIGILAQPYIPKSAIKLLNLCGKPMNQRNFSNLNHHTTNNEILPKPQHLFPRNDK